MTQSYFAGCVSEKKKAVSERWCMDSSVNAPIMISLFIEFEDYYKFSVECMPNFCLLYDFNIYHYDNMPMQYTAVKK